jgi:hypothetical protein
MDPGSLLWEEAQQADIELEMPQPSPCIKQGRRRFCW